MWAARYRNFDKQVVRQGKSISTVWMDDLCQIELEISFFWLGHGMLQTMDIHKRFADVCETQIFIITILKLIIWESM